MLNNVWPEPLIKFHVSSSSAIAFRCAANAVDDDDDLDGLFIDRIGD